ncbi:MAG: S8 family serine peptidase [Candidatus Saganbacteria bacterium]|nr:S8 family serine peptidase [Candidatus Saganbacteria bacterium]
MYSPSKIPGRVKFIPNEILVQFKPGSSMSSGILSISSVPTDSSLAGLNKKYGAANMRKLFAGKKNTGILSISHALDGIYKITISKGADIQSIAKEYAALPEVEFAQPNGLFEICRTPNDPDYKTQWGLFKIFASKGWDAKVGDPKVVIAVIDTGVDYNHPDLSSNIWINSNEIKPNGCMRARYSCFRYSCRSHKQ